MCWTDGGCRGNPGPGAWAYLMVDPRSGRAIERTGGERETTNNRMEMQGAIQALLALKQPGTSVLIQSDSRYLIDCCTTWMAGWKRNGWKRKEGPLKNVDLLQELDRLHAVHRVTWRWVKGHAGDPGNEHVDALLNAAMDRLACGRPVAHERHLTWRDGREVKA